MINIHSSSRYKINRVSIKRELMPFLLTHGFDDSHILNIVFIGKNKMKQIANTYKHENVALPVLSFPYDKSDPTNDHLIGEVFVCFPQAVLLAAQRNKRVDDIINFLIKHAVQTIIK